MSIKHIDMSGEKPRWVRNPIVSPRFDEKAYKGQDIVHYGVRIPLQGDRTPEDILALMHKTVRHRSGMQDEVRFRAMEDGDLSLLRYMWFDPHDPTFPTTMDDHIGIVAYRMTEQEGVAVVLGGIIWKPEGNNLFLHQLIAAEEGKRLRVTERLVWESVREFWHKQYHSLDIGVSYNPKRHAFFKKFRVEKYPIILKKPELVPVIRLAPYRTSERPPAEAKEFDWEKENATFAPRGAYALLALLKHLNLQPDDEVCIQKTFHTKYVSKCVTDQIEKVCKWTLATTTERTKVVLVIHEFGIPCHDVFVPSDRPVVLIEDCAWRPGKVLKSDYAIYSMSKCFPIQYGGAIEGVHIPDEKMWEYGCLDYVKKQNFARDMAGLEFAEDHRRIMWQHYNELVKADGMTPEDSVLYEKMVQEGEWAPTVYLQKFESESIADAIVARLEEFGIQAGRYWGERVVFLPIHQEMTLKDVEYMFAVVKGYFNSCRDYKGV